MFFTYNFLKKVKFYFFNAMLYKIARCNETTSKHFLFKIYLGIQNHIISSFEYDGYRPTQYYRKPFN